MNKSDDISKLALALCLAQPVIKVALMDSVNPFFKSKYADLGAVWDAVKPALKEQGLAVSQFPDHIGQEPALTTMLIHISGQWLSGTYPLMVTDKDHTPQGYGSALTYARRYGLSAVLGVIADSDDDGNAASGRHKPTQREAIHGTSTLKTSVAADAYAPMEQGDGAGKNAVQDFKVANARAWALGEIPRIKTMDKTALDKFCERFRKARIDLAVLDTKASVELEKAIADRLEALFA